MWILRLKHKKGSDKDLNILIKYVKSLHNPKPIIPPIERIRQIEKNPERYSIEYQVIPPFATIKLYYDFISENIIYEVQEPYLSEREEEQLKRIKNKIIDYIYFEDLKDIENTPKEAVLARLLYKIYKKSKDIDIVSLPKYFYYLWRDLIGLGKIEPVMHDPLVEDISCDGYNIPVYVHHRILGILKTNIIYSRGELDREILRFAQKSGRFISFSNPILDATLPDGSRINATYSSDVTTRGPTFTIRKFHTEKFSIVDLILSNTLSVDMASYLWWAVENRANILIAGETSSGKTTMLNAISMFIPPNAKIVSIEDTREIQLYHENWIPAVTRKGFMIENEEIGKVTMYDLLKESFRQNPDYVIVGEVRGQEAYVMFQGMASGHAALSTMHAESLHAIIKRFTTPPINLPIDLIELLDIAIFMVRAKNISPSARRVRSIYEVGKYIDNKLETTELYKWNPINDNFNKMGSSIIIREIEERTGYNRNFEKDIKEKRTVLQYLVNNKIRSLKEVNNIIKEYYLNRDHLINYIGQTYNDR